MGVSTDAQICFGFEIGDEGDELKDLFPDLFGEDIDDEEFDDVIARLAGLEPWSKDRAEDYYERKRKLIEQCPVQLVMHCSHDVPMWILAVRGTFRNSNRGYALEIDLPTIPDEKVDAFRVWCEQYNVEYQEPLWLMTSLWA
jgi:hypothetical protein